MSRIITTSFIILAAALSAAAQDAQAARTLTLEECRQLAVQNNASVRIAAANAKAAHETRQEAFTKYFPEIKASAIGFKAHKAVFQYNVLDLFDIELVKKGYTASIYALQPVFAGGRIVNGNKLASVGADAAVLESRGAVDNALLTTEQYYWQIVTLKSKKSTLTQVIEMLDTLYAQVKVAVDAGVVNNNELLKVQLKRNDMLANMVDLDNGIALATNLLAQYIGLDGQAIDIADNGAPQELPLYPSDLYMPADQALGATVDYQLLDAKAEAAKLERRIAVGQNLPTVGIGAGYFYDDLLNQHHGFFAGFVSVQVPLSAWWGGSHAIKRSKIAENNAQEERTNLGQMLKIKMQDTWDNLTAAYRKMQIAQESICQSAENLRISRNFYDAGVSTITDLLDAQTLYRQACDQYTEAYGNFCLCRAQYIDATGRTAID